MTWPSQRMVGCSKFFQAVVDNDWERANKELDARPDACKDISKVRDASIFSFFWVDVVSVREVSLRLNVIHA